MTDPDIGDTVDEALDEAFRAEHLRFVDEAESIDPDRFAPDEWDRLREIMRTAPLESLGRILYAQPFAIRRPEDGAERT